MRSMTEVTQQSAVSGYQCTVCLCPPGVFFLSTQWSTPEYTVKYTAAHTVLAWGFYIAINYYNNAASMCKFITIVSSVNLDWLSQTQGPSGDPCFQSTELWPAGPIFPSSQEWGEPSDSSDSSSYPWEKANMRLGQRRSADEWFNVPLQCALAWVWGQRTQG